MRLKKERIAALARILVDQLTEQRLLRLEAPKADVTALLDQIISDEMMIEDRLDAEVRKILDAYKAQIDQGQVDERTMFLMIKKQLVKERGMIL
jgi:uncharacterized protein